MKLIQKGKEPPSLREYRSDPFATYEGYPAKDDLRQALAREQGHICCYCMGRISPDADAMKIEHWAPQSSSPSLQLAYTNLLGACRGGEGRARSMQHCDTHKGEDPIGIDPTKPHCEQSIRYSAEGEIASGDPQIHRDLCEILNLNEERLRGNRKGALKGLVEAMNKKYGAQKSWTAAMLTKEIAALRGDTGRYPAFCQTLIYFLEKWLRARA